MASPLPATPRTIRAPATSFAGDNANDLDHFVSGSKSKFVRQALSNLKNKNP